MIWLETPGEGFRQTDRQEDEMTDEMTLTIGRTRYRMHALTSRGALRDRMYSVGEWAATPELALTLPGHLSLREGGRVAIVEQVYEGIATSICSASLGLPEHIWRTVGVVRVLDTSEVAS